MIAQYMKPLAAAQALTCGFFMLFAAMPQAQDAAPTPTPVAGIANRTGISMSMDGETTTAVSGEAVTTAPAKDGALESAMKMVAPVGASLTSTDERELATTDAVAQAPSLAVSQDGVIAPSGPDAEAKGIKSAADLLLALKIVKRPTPKAVGTREIDEQATQTKLYNEEEFRRFLGKDPTVMYQVVYKGEPLPDPMIVPWIRSVVVLQERFDEAVELLANQQIQRGTEILLDIQTNYPDTEYGRQAGAILLRLRDITQPVATPAPQVTAPQKTPTVTDVRMDPKVKISTVITDPSDEAQNRVMINGKTYAPGETVRDFDNHKVVRVTDDAVTMEVEQAGQKREFVVPVRQFSGSNR